MPTRTEPDTCLLLDTHVWIWLLEGVPGKLDRSDIRLITRTSETAGLLVSAISVWELGVLEAKGRVSLSTGIHAWVERALDAPGVTLAGISPAIALDASRLPGASHGDPADRILIATARQHGARLATRDRAILDYARTGALLVHRV